MPGFSASVRSMAACGVAFRVHPCPRCLTVLEVPLAGGFLRCGCGFERSVGPRSTRPLGARTPMEEAERLRRLAADVDPPYLDGPTAIATAGKERFSASEAVAIWQRVYGAALSRPDDAALANALVHFTVACANSLTYERGSGFTRAAIEATLDHTRDPVAQQDMRCVLSRGAAREGDLASAEAWLEPCDAGSPILRADSTYRLSRAIIDVQRSRPDAALAVLGEQPGQVPFSPRQSLTAALARAHAHELSGREDEAIRQLRAEMQRHDPGDPTMNSIFASNAPAEPHQDRPCHEPAQPCPRTVIAQVGRQPRVQSSQRSPGIRRNSRLLFVTSTAPSESACAPMIVSRAPMGRP